MNPSCLFAPPFSHFRVTPYSATGPVPPVFRLETRRSPRQRSLLILSLSAESSNSLSSAIMFNSNYVLITCLLLAGAVTIHGQKKPFPDCKPPAASPSDLPAHFVFFIDFGLEPELLSRVLYLIKAISCEIPDNENVLSIVVSYAQGQTTKSENMTSARIGSEIHRIELSRDNFFEDQCGNFAKALQAVPGKFINSHVNVQFIVPIVGDNPNCSIIDTFRTHFSNPDRVENTKNLFFNGILVNSNLTERNKRSIRLHIPDIMADINLNNSLFRRADTPAEAERRDSMLKSFDAMMANINNGSSVNDWELPETTTTSESPTTTMISSTTLTSSTQKPDEEDEEPMMAFDEDDDEAEKVLGVANLTINNNDWEEMNTTAYEMNTTTSELNVTNSSELETALPTSTTTSEPTSTTEVPIVTDVATEDIADYDEDLDSDTDLTLAKSAKQESTSEVGETEKEKTIDADFVILMLLLLLLIWLFCLFMCLVWMFYCAKRKKNRIEDDAAVELQQNMPLLDKNRVEPTLPPPPPPTVSSSKKTSDSDDSDDEWKKIREPNYSASAPQSETESVKQPDPAIRYHPVEVSEFEDGKMDEDVVDRPRHGYLKPKKAADLYFE